MCWIWILFAVFIVFIAAVYLLFPSPPNYELRDSHVLVTGGSSGIGKAVAELAVAQGARVTILARDKKKLEQAKNDISSKRTSNSGKEVVHTISVDLCGDFDTIEKAIVEAESVMGPIDFCINNAGMACLGRFEEAPVGDFQKEMDVNYLSGVKVTRAVVPGMKRRQKGRIVFVSSMSGQAGLYGYSAYSASKFALRGLAESLQMELQLFNIYVTLAHPVDTETPGYHEENKMKPIETKLISDIASVFQPEQVASALLKDAVRGRFFSHVGFDSWACTILTSGSAPAGSALDVIQQVLFMGIIRFVSLFYLEQFQRIIRKCKLDKEKEESSQETKKMT